MCLWCIVSPSVTVSNNIEFVWHSTVIVFSNFYGDLISSHLKNATGLGALHLMCSQNQWELAKCDQSPSLHSITCWWLVPSEAGNSAVCSFPHRWPVSFSFRQRWSNPWFLYHTSNLSVSLSDTGNSILGFLTHRWLDPLFYHMVYLVCLTLIIT